MPFRLCPPAVCLLACLVLTGCVATAPNTRTAADFSPADLDSVAVVFSRGDIAEKTFWTTTADTAATALANRIVPTLLVEYAPHFGVTLVDARERLAADSAIGTVVLTRIDEAVEAVRAENREISQQPYFDGLKARRQPLASAVAEEVVEISRQTGCRYLLSVSVTGWEASAEEKVAEGLLRGAALAFGYLVVGGQPNRLVVIETALVDTERGEVVWYSTRGAALDPRSTDHLAALTRTVAFELFDDQLIAPQSFLSVIDQDGVVYRHDGPRVTGRVEGFDGLDVVVATRNGEERVPLRDVKSIRSFSGTGKLYPLHVPMEE